MTPAKNRCRSCGAPISLHQKVRGQLCDDTECRRAAVEQDILDVKQRHLEQVTERVLSTATELAPDLGLATDTTPLVAIVPHSHQPLVAADPRRQEALRQHLLEVATQLTSEGDGGEGDGDAPAVVTVRGDDPAAMSQMMSAMAAMAAAASGDHGTDDHPTDADAPAWPRVVAQVCAACRGQCCWRGADAHAFLTAKVLRRYLRRLPDATADDIVAAYMRWLPRRVIEGSCVYHGEHGCGLPRPMRADNCNDYLCEGMTKARGELAERPDAPVVGVSTSGIFPRPRFSPPDIERGVFLASGGGLTASYEGFDRGDDDSDDGAASADA